jgi:H/ACA ribonucleoprotein complex subunit 4
VSGILPVPLEEARKIVQILLHGSKEYVCLLKLHGQVSQKKVREVLKEFEGAIYQRPPLRSSVKRQLRKRVIYYIDCLETERRNVLFKVGCEGGTYIRKLCYDIGEVLRVGAHMQELRRTRAGPFIEDEEMATLHDVAYWFKEWQQQKDAAILRKFIQPMEKALALTPKIYIRDSAVDAVCHGANLTAPGVVSLESGITRNATIAVLTLKGEAVALAKALTSTEEILKMDHGVVSETKRVLMPRGKYPKCWRSSDR